MKDIAKFTEDTVAYLRDLPPEALRFQRRDLDIVCPRCEERKSTFDRFCNACGERTAGVAVPAA